MSEMFCVEEVGEDVLVIAGRSHSQRGQRYAPRVEFMMRIVNYNPDAKFLYGRLLFPEVKWIGFQGSLDDLRQIVSRERRAALEHYLFMD